METTKHRPQQPDNCSRSKSRSLSERKIRKKPKNRRSSDRYSKERPHDRRDKAPHSRRSRSRDRRSKSRDRRNKSRDRRDRSRDRRSRSRDRRDNRDRSRDRRRKSRDRRDKSRDRRDRSRDRRSRSRDRKSHSRDRRDQRERSPDQREKTNNQHNQNNQYTQHNHYERPYAHQQEPSRRDREFLNKWTGISKFKNFIENTSILPTKCPLSSKYNSLLAGPAKFEWNEVFEFANTQQKPIACIINLANTLKYYDHTLLPQDVKFHHFPIAGQSKPADHILNQIVEILHHYNNQGKGVVIHCTHGVNRTGYIICKYLMVKQNLKKDASVSIFQRDRGQNIERDIYLQELQDQTPATTYVEEKPLTLSDLVSTSVETAVSETM